MSETTDRDHTGPPASPLRRVWWFIEVANVRLRFLFLMVAVGLVVGYWEHITNYYDRWTRPAVAPDAAAGEDVEFFCPMHPNIIRDELGSCPICGMPLSKRAKTAQTALPEGVLARQQLSPFKVQIGRIATSPVEHRLLSRETRTVGIIDYDETRRKRIAARIAGRIDELLVNYTGQQVAGGDPLALIYSPDLLTAQQELLTAHHELAAAGTTSPVLEATYRSLVEASRQKLLLWGITDGQIDEILKRATPETHLTIYSPMGGIVTEKRVLEGHYVSEGAELYTIADLSNVWMQAKIYEEDLPGITVGTAVEVRSTAHPDEVFAGRITFIAYEIDPATRTAAARVEIGNPELKLKPGMYAHAVIRVPVGRITETDPETVATESGPAGPDTSALINAYLAVSTALVADQVAGAVVDKLVDEAKRLAGVSQTAVATAAARVTKAAGALKDKDLEAQRGLLAELSARVIELARNTPPPGQTLYVANCPMVEADWLQTEEKLANPYMGSRMLRCGSLTGTISLKATQDYGEFVTGYYCPITPDRLFERPELCPVDKFPFKYVKIAKTLAVPASAVINTGTRTIVYRESAPGTFDMLEVKLGARAGEYFPVLAGIEPGARVATAGAFLVDAENRLNPAASVQYFGASGGP
jgi:multidrug efflux pump subunit AcrA (membrane-fusion protein)